MYTIRLILFPLTHALLFDDDLKKVDREVVAGRLIFPIITKPFRNGLAVVRGVPKAVLQNSSFAVLCARQEDVACGEKRGGGGGGFGLPLTDESIDGRTERV